MTKTFMMNMVKLLGGVALVAAAPLALAGGHSSVNWSVTVGSGYPAPMVYGPPPAVYVQPQPVYVRPQPVYVAPQPVYVQPAPVVVYGGPAGYGKFRHHWKHHHPRYYGY